MIQAVDRFSSIGVFCLFFGVLCCCFRFAVFWQYFLLPCFSSLAAWCVLAAGGTAGGRKNRSFANNHHRLTKSHCGLTSNHRGEVLLAD